MPEGRTSRSHTSTPIRPLLGVLSKGEVKMAKSMPKGGAPYGNRNSFKHGMYTRQEMAAAKERREFYRDCGSLLKEMRKVIAERIACPAQ